MAEHDHELHNDDELAAFTTAARRAGLDHEPLTLELFDRVIARELAAIGRQLDALEREAP